MQPAAPFMAGNPFYSDNHPDYGILQNTTTPSTQGFYSPYYPQAAQSFATSPGLYYAGYQTECAGAVYDTSPLQSPITVPPSSFMPPSPQPTIFPSDSYPGTVNGYMTYSDNAPYTSSPAQPSPVQAPRCDNSSDATQAPGYRRRNVAVPCSQARQLPSGLRDCPFCDYTQKGRRAQDLRRHIATHTRPTAVVLWSCCGVPRSEAAQHGVPDARLGGPDPCMAGGCGQPFSRRDALQRHLRERRGRCFGDASADWHPGNTI